MLHGMPHKLNKALKLYLICNLGQTIGSGRVKTAVSKKLGGSDFTVSGISGDKTWSKGMKLPHDGRTTGIARLWARNQVEDWMDDLMLGGDHQLLKDQIIALALDHHLVTEYTSLVAVDKTPNLTRQAQAKAAQTVPFPQGSLGIKGQLLLGSLLLMIGFLLSRRADSQKSA